MARQGLAVRSKRAAAAQVARRQPMSADSYRTKL